MKNTAWLSVVINLSQRQGVVSEKQRLCRKPIDTVEKSKQSVSSMTVFSEWWNHSGTSE